VPSKKTLTSTNLEALGAQRLAELLIEVSTGNAAVKQRLRLELAGAHNPGEVAKEVRKRLTTIARSRTFIDWQNRRTLVEDLEAQRSAIVKQVANADLTEALELMWRFMALANSIFERCDDSSGTVISIFRAACRNLAEIVQVAKVAPEVLAERAFNALYENDYGQYDELIGVLSPALGPTGLELLNERFLELSKAPPEGRKTGIVK
jgi:predicted component of type VI protein secretion system